MNLDLLMGHMLQMVTAGKGNWFSVPILGMGGGGSGIK